MTAHRAASLALAVAGLAVSTYLTAVHFTAGQVTLLCSTTGLIDCERVTSSAESMVGPVPVAVLGMLWFVVMLALVVVGQERMSSRVAALPLIWAAGGLFFVLYLIYAELFIIGAFCLWCTVVHVLVIALFLIVLSEYGNLIDAAEDQSKT